MRFVDLTIKEFLAQIDAPTPTPGGGSVASIVIAHGISLIRMVAHLTVNKVKFKALPEDIQKRYFDQFNQLAKLKDEILLLSDADSASYNKVVLAYRMPKDTLEDKEKRNQQITLAIINATEVPYQVLQLGMKVLTEAIPMYEYANKTTLSDFGVGIKLIEAGMVGAKFNIDTNMRNFENRIVAKSYLSNSQLIIDKAFKIIKPILQKINESFD